MTTKKTTKTSATPAVAKTTTTVAKEATKVVKSKKPTITSLQEDLRLQSKAYDTTIENLEQRLSEANQSFEYQYNINKELTSDVLKLKEVIKSVESRSIFAQILAKLSAPFK